jgi:predicted SAM-dependent methyltransferase
MAETYKARDRRLRTGWFEKYAPIDQLGIDIGCGDDPLHQTFIRWDAGLGSGDAALMAGVPDELYHTVYSSHVLEHVENYPVALRNWWRITAPEGHLIVVVPHRDLYEKKLQPPSIWNGDHKWFWLPDQDKPPRTLSLRRVLADILPTANLVSFEVLQDGWEDVGADVHATGEYSIEAILKKGRE